MFQYLEYVDWRQVKRIAIIALVTSVIGFFVCDCVFSEPHDHRGIITEKVFTPERYWTTVTVHNSSGHTYTSVENHYSPPQWDLIVWGDDNRKADVPVNVNFYQTANISDSISYKTYVGCFTRWRWFSRRVESDW